jgi:hypothetical protein
VSGALLAVAAWACSAPSLDTPAATPPTEPLFGRAATAGPTVSSTQPSYAYRGTTVDVHVIGRGFVAGAQATWLLHGVANSAKVRTNSTTYVSSTDVVANITVSSDADLALWDVQIAAGGKNGVGTEVSAITAGTVTVTEFISNDPAYSLRGDGGYLESTGASRYFVAECGVSSAFYSQPGGSGDVTMATGSHGKCTRRVRFDYAAINADGSTMSEGTITTPSFLNVRKLQVAATSTTPGSYIPVGGDGQRTFAFDDAGTKCGSGGNQAINFAPTLVDGTFIGGDFVNVHRDAADTWTVTTTPDEIDAITGQTIHHDKAYCRGNGKLYHIPLRFTIRSSRPLTP